MKPDTPEEGKVLTDQQSLPGSRVIIKEKYDGIEVIVPSKKDFSKILLLPLWLLGWFIGELFVGAAFVHAVLDMLIHRTGVAVEPMAVMFILLWLTFWTMGGIFIIKTLLTIFFGRQIIRFSPYEISIVNKICWIGKERIFEMTQVRDFQITQQQEPKDDRRHPVKSDVLFFSYDGEKIEFGRGMQKEEMESLINLLKKYMYLRQGNLPRKDTWEKKDTWRKKEHWKRASNEEDYFASAFSNEKTVS